MDNQFDELSKSLAEGISRREALRKFGIGLAGMLLASIGLGRGQGAGAQSSVQCCLWTCRIIKHTDHITTCGSPCPNPSSSERFCQLKSSKTVSDCTACK